MFRTGTPEHDGKTYGRELLSRYDTRIGLNNYIAYEDIRSTIKALDKAGNSEPQLDQHPLQNILRQQSIDNKNIIPSDPQAQSTLTMSGSTMCGSPVSTPQKKQTHFNPLLNVRDLSNASTVEGVDEASISCFSDGAVVPTSVQKNKVAEAEARFFLKMEESLVKVNYFLDKQDRELSLVCREAGALTLKELKSANRGAPYIEALFIRLHSVNAYRELNLEGFGKALRKCFMRCALESLELQRKLRVLDERIQQSTLCKPLFSYTSAMSHCACLLSMVTTENATSFEGCMKRLHIASLKASATGVRIVPFSESFFHQTHRVNASQTRGDFALRLVPCSTNRKLTKHIGYNLKILDPVVKCKANEFPDGQVDVGLNEAVRGDDVYVIQPMATNILNKLSLSGVIMELIVMIEALRAASAARVTAVIPYLAYSESPHDIAAVAEMLQMVGCNGVVTLDLFRDQVEGMFGNIPVDNISAKWEFINYIVKQLREQEHDFKDLCVVAPESDGVPRARKFADSLTNAAKTEYVGVAATIKRAGTENTLDVIGEVKGKECFILDNRICGGRLMASVARRLREAGATRVTAVATSLIVVPETIEILSAAPIDEVIVTDAVNCDEVLRHSSLAHKVRILSVAPLLAQAIERIHTNANTRSMLLEK